MLTFNRSYNSIDRSIAYERPATIPISSSLAAMKSSKSINVSFAFARNGLRLLVKRADGRYEDSYGLLSQRRQNSDQIGSGGQR